MWLPLRNQFRRQTTDLENDIIVITAPKRHLTKHRKRIITPASKFCGHQFSSRPWDVLSLWFSRFFQFCSSRWWDFLQARHLLLTPSFQSPLHVPFSSESVPEELHDWKGKSVHTDRFYSYYRGVAQNERAARCLHLTPVTYSYSSLGRAVAQAVSRWLPTAAARVWSRVWSSGICGGQSGGVAGFLRVLRFPLPIFIPPNSSSS
jgi:hypothetical protein